MGAKVDLVGQSFGYLTVTHFYGMSQDGMVRLWACQCDCGGVIVVPTKRLRNGATRSCGCLRTKQLIARNTRHGESKTPLYRLWRAMLNRCQNPSNPAYPRYGGRGITVCPEWYEFSSFKESMGDCPPGKSLERVDNNGPYSPENCIWATPKEQNSNRRDNVLVRLSSGDIVTVTEAARRLTIPRMTLTRRLKSGEFLGARLWDNT